MSKVPSNSSNSSDIKNEKSGSSLISRRAFLGVSGGAAAALAGLFTMKFPGFDFSSSSDYIADGYEYDKYTYTSCLNCTTRCAINVRKVIYKDSKERVVRILGNPNSSYSDGKACPRSHIGLQVLYNPERITKPLKRKSGVSKGKNEHLSWEDQWEEIEWEGENGALNIIKNRLNDISDPGNLLIIQGLNTSSDEDLINRFAASFGTTNLIREDDIETDANREGKKLADGCVNQGYDLGKANYILSFGADIIESETPLARNLRLWGKIRRERPNKARVVVIDPRYSITASKADEWIRVKPGTEGALAMAIANVIIDDGLYDKDFVNNTFTSGFDDYVAEAANFSPSTVADITGIDAETITRIAREFAEVKPAIAWSGAGATSWRHGTYASHAIYCLNALVGSIDVPGGIIYQRAPEYKAMVPAIAAIEPMKFKAAADLILDNTSNIEAAIGFNNNLIMSVPDTATWQEALSNIPYYIHIASAKTEMACYADIILPACTYLEEWAYESVPPGSGYIEVKIKQPVVEPEGDSRSTCEIIFSLAKTMGGTVKTDFDDLGPTPKDFVQFRTDAMWGDLTSTGVWTEDEDNYQYAGEIDNAADRLAAYKAKFQNTEKLFKFNSYNLNQLTPQFQGNETQYHFNLVTYHPVLDIRNGSQNYPWAQEIFLVMHGRGWNNFVEINKQDADDIKIKDGDNVKVTSQSGEIEIKARVIEGINRGTVAIAIGQGHYNCGEWADDIGENPNIVIGPDYDTASGQAIFANTRVDIKKA